ncbi:MAG TPA: MFS transporter, partial [Terriglobales bacterium]|nr:MFS transporter [Terriglobales bacterium]
MFSNRHLLFLLLFRTSRSVAAGMITLAFPYLVLNKYHYGSLTLGFLYTAAAVATALAGLLVGFLADLWGRKRSLWLIGAMLPVSSAIVLGTHHLAWLFVAAVLGGYSATGSLIGGGVGGAAQPVQTAIIASLAESKERTSYFSVFSFLGGLLAAGGSLAARLFTTRDVFAAATVVAGAGLVFLIPLRLPEPAGHLRRM